MSDVRRIASHSALALAEAALIALLVGALVASTAFAARGSGGKGGGGKPSGGSGTISGPILVESADSVVSYGDSIRFTVSTSSTTEPWVRLKCYQGRTLVAQGAEGYFERALSDGVFGLYSGTWTGGDADCTANLTKPDGSVLASVSFHAYP